MGPGSTIIPQPPIIPLQLPKDTSHANDAGAKADPAVIDKLKGELTTVGKRGPDAVIRAIQSVLKVDQDGKFGPKSAKAYHDLQEKVAAGKATPDEKAFVELVGDHGGEIKKGEWSKANDAIVKGLKEKGVTIAAAKPVSHQQHHRSRARHPDHSADWTPEKISSEAAAAAALAQKSAAGASAALGEDKDHYKAVSGRDGGTTYEYMTPAEARADRSNSVITVGHGESPAPSVNGASGPASPLLPPAANRSQRPPDPPLIPATTTAPAAKTAAAASSRGAQLAGIY